MKTLGERIKHLRGSRSQAEFALLFGIPQVTLGNYERNRNEPKFDLVRQICSLFEINVEWLLFGTGPVYPGKPAPSRASHPCVPQAAPERLLDARGNACTRCARLEMRLEEVERERRELTAEIRHLWKENGELREKCARFEERALSTGDHNALGSAG